MLDLLLLSEAFLHQWGFCLLGPKGLCATPLPIKLQTPIVHCMGFGMYVSFGFLGGFLFVPEGGLLFVF